MAAQQVMYINGTTGRGLVDKIDQLDFSKCVGRTVSNKTDSVSVGFEQLKLNVLAHIQQQPFFTVDSSNLISSQAITTSSEAYFRDLRISDLPDSISFFPRGMKNSSRLRQQQLGASDNFEGHSLQPFDSGRHPQQMTENDNRKRNYYDIESEADAYVHFQGHGNQKISSMDYSKHHSSRPFEDQDSYGHSMDYSNHSSRPVEEQNSYFSEGRHHYAAPSYSSRDYYYSQEEQKQPHFSSSRQSDDQRSYRRDRDESFSYPRHSSSYGSDSSSQATEEYQSRRNNRASSSSGTNKC